MSVAHPENCFFLLNDFLDKASTPSSFTSTNTRESIQEYARSLLASLPDPVPQENGDSSPSSTESGPSFGTGNSEDGGTDGQAGKRINLRRAEELRRTESERERVEEVNLTGCREAVEILTRNPKKGIYKL